MRKLIMSGMFIATVALGSSGPTSAGPLMDVLQNQHKAAPAATIIEARRGVRGGGLITCQLWVSRCNPTAGYCNNPAALVNPSCTRRGNA